MPELPHFAWPMAFTTAPDGTVGYAMVEQDSTADLQASAAVIASTPRDHRIDDPQFGVTQPVFDEGRLDTTRLSVELTQSDERLDLGVEETVALSDAMTRELDVHDETPSA